MKFALDTYRDVVYGERDRKIHAAFTFALWFALGGYLVSSFSPLIEAVTQHAPNSVLGGIIFSAIAALVKTS